MKQKGAKKRRGTRQGASVGPVLGGDVLFGAASLLLYAAKPLTLRPDPSSDIRSSRHNWRA
jgi:hypothetical protein